MPQTESKQVKGYFLRVREDFILNSALGEILTDKTLLEVKLPAKLENYKYRSMLNFGNLLTFDLVKTRKHWIVTHIECYEKLDYSAWSYLKFEVLVQMNKLLLQNLHLDQECQILDWLRDELYSLNTSKTDFDQQNFLADFLLKLEVKLGFKSN
jgi:hypothetical protein